MKKEKQKIDKIFTRTKNLKLIHEAILHVENIDGTFSFSEGYGGKNIDTPMFMASITKLFTTSCILILKEQGELSLDHKVTRYFEKDTLDGLHVYKGQDYSASLTLYHLLFQTSGLPDIFEEGRKNAKKRVMQEDIATTFDEKIAMTKHLTPHFVPNTDKKAHYADINFDMLGKVIEKVAGVPLEDAYQQFIFGPLALQHTNIPNDKDDFVPNVYYKDAAFHRPKTIISGRASGGCISTARELMIFIKAFFGGELFNKSVFHELDMSHKLQVSMLPIRYGSGYMRIPLNGLSTLFMGKGELIGHSGSTGSFAFYHRDKDLFVVGDVNQMANPALPIRLVMRLAMAMKAP